MISDGAASNVTEVGPGKVLQGLFKKVDRAFPTSSATLAYGRSLNASLLLLNTKSHPSMGWLFLCR